MNNESTSTLREHKIEFLKKLQSGRYRLLALNEPQLKLNFDLQSDGLYQCREDRRLMTAKEVKSLPGYMLIIERVSTTRQANQEEPAEGYTLIPFTKKDYLNGILISIDNENEVFGGDFNAALSEMTTEELKHLHRQLMNEAKNADDKDQNRRVNPI